MGFLGCCGFCGILFLFLVCVFRVVLVGFGFGDFFFGFVLEVVVCCVLLCRWVIVLGFVFCVVYCCRVVLFVFAGVFRVSGVSCLALRAFVRCIAFGVLLGFGS